MTDLPAYPHAPGDRGTDTSAEAAAAIAADCGRLQRLVFTAVFAAGEAGLTTNEIAARLEIGRDSIQPRTSELKALGRIRDSGRRRANANGKSAIVWIAVQPAQPKGR
jgi:hypothetical protein